MRCRAVFTAAALCATAIAATNLSPATAQAADPPPGFVDESVASFFSPTAVEWLPGNRIVVLEQAGRVRVGRPGESFSTAVNLDVCSNSERGLLGIAADPGFLSNGWVYLYYTDNGPSGCVNRVSRFTMSNDTIDVGSEVILLDNIASTGSNHNGGDLDIGSDGNLYVAIGDAGTDPRLDSGSAGGNDAAQDLSILNGKIARITRSGDPAPGNPFTGTGTTRCATLGTSASPSTQCQEIYAWGLRNPFRFAFDRDDGSDRFYINDVGQSTYEEVSEGAIGNFGWPTREGFCDQGQIQPCDGPPSNLIDPIAAYGRNDGTFITAGAFVPDGLWPDEYDGTYLFADGGSGDIWLMNENGGVDYGDPFATGAFGLTDMAFGFDVEGHQVLYYTAPTNGGELRMIRETNGVNPVLPEDLAIDPITPIRAYDTGNGTGVAGAAAGDMLPATTRIVDLDPPNDVRAALVNITMNDTAGSGFVRTWQPGTMRPETSSVNAFGPNATVGTAVIVPLADDGTFVLEASTGTRVVVDVMAWMRETGGTAAAGRFMPLDPARLIDTREPADTLLDSGSTNPYEGFAVSNPTGGSRGEFDFNVAGQIGVPDDGTVSAAVLSVAAIPTPGSQGRATLVPAGTDDSGTANVNVTPGEVRNNLVIVPLAGGTRDVTAYVLNLDSIVVDVLGYVTSDTAATSGSGLYMPTPPNRIVDTREGLGFDRLSAGTSTPMDYTDTPASAVVHTITVTQPAADGWIVAHPATPAPTVSNLNYGANDTRGTLAFSSLNDDGGLFFTARVETDVVVDTLGFFTE